MAGHVNVMGASAASAPLHRSGGGGRLTARPSAGDYDSVHKSLNRTITGTPMESLHRGDGKDRKRDLSDLAGTWSDEEAEEFEANTRVFEQIDHDAYSTFKCEDGTLAR